MTNKLLKYLGIASLITLGLILTGVFNQGGFGLLLILVSLFLVNLESALIKRKKWNHGICKKTNHQWDLHDVIYYTDSSWDYIFKSGDEILCIDDNGYINEEFCGTYFTDKIEIKQK